MSITAESYNKCHRNIAPYRSCRAPFGKKFRDVVDIIDGYSNLELDLVTGKRENRLDITARLLRLLTDAKHLL